MKHRKSWIDSGFRKKKDRSILIQALQNIVDMPSEGKTDVHQLSVPAAYPENEEESNRDSAGETSHTMPRQAGKITKIWYKDKSAHLGMVETKANGKLWAWNYTLNNGKYFDPTDMEGALKFARGNFPEEQTVIETFETKQATASGGWMIGPNGEIRNVGYGGHGEFMRKLHRNQKEGWMRLSLAADVLGIEMCDNYDLELQTNTTDSQLKILQDAILKLGIKATRVLWSTDEETLNLSYDDFLSANSVAKARYIHRQAEIGQGLSQLTTERETGKTRQTLTEPSRWNESYHDDNQFEDKDLKLGESETKDVDPVSTSVYPPYTDGIGQPNPRYEDANQEQRTITLHAAESTEEEINPNKGPRKLWVAVDLDGTILEPPPEGIYQDQSGKHLFGEPIEGSREALQELIDGGAKVSIYTARQYFAHGKEQEQALKEAVEDQLAIHDISFTDVYVGKKPPAHYYIDDRNIPFKGDWDLALDAVRDKLKKQAGEKLSLDSILNKEWFDRAMVCVNHAINYTSKDFELGLIELKLVVEDLYEATQTSGDTSSLLNRGVDIINQLRQYLDNNQYVVDAYQKDNVVNDVNELFELFRAADHSVKPSKRTPVFENTQIHATKEAANDPVKDQKDYHGIKINVEWPKGSIRSYKDSDTYVTHMKCDYGYAPGINGGTDGDLDIYLGDGDSDIAFIIEQLKEDCSYDEDKVMLGFNSEEEAADCYLQHMPNYMLGDVRSVPVERLVNALYGEPEDRRTASDKESAYADLALSVLELAKVDEDVAEFISKYITGRRPIDVIDELARLLIGSPDIAEQLEAIIGQKVSAVPFTIADPQEELQKVDPDRTPSGTLKLTAIDKTAAYSDLAMRAIESMWDPKFLGLDEVILKHIDTQSEPINQITQLVRAMLVDPNLKTQIESIIGKEPVVEQKPKPKPTRPQLTQRHMDTLETLKYLNMERDDKGMIGPWPVEAKKRKTVKTKSDYVGPQTSQVGDIGGVGADVESSAVWPSDKDDENLNTDADESYDNRDVSRGRMT